MASENFVENNSKMEKCGLANSGPEHLNFTNNTINYTIIKLKKETFLLFILYTYIIK